MNYSKNKLISYKTNQSICSKELSVAPQGKPAQTSFERERFQKNMHLFINHTYHKLLFCKDEKQMLNELTLNKLKHLEDIWINRVKKECECKYNIHQSLSNINIIEQILKKHPVFNHELYDFLSDQADENDFKKFIQNESILNLEFFDYLALSLVGSSGQIKSEITANLWDEAGRGDESKSHTNMFSKLLIDLGIDYNRNNMTVNMPWEALAGINLFNYLSYHSHQKIKYYGLLAATEMLDPYHYPKLIKGFSRLYPNNQVDYSYYTEHQLVDIAHAKSWLQNIILPELTKYPEKSSDFWLGFYLRLDSIYKYYNRLLNNFTKRIVN